MAFNRIMAHAGNNGKEFLDKLAKEVVKKDIAFNRIPKCEGAQHFRGQSIATSQTQCNRNKKR